MTTTTTARKILLIANEIVDDAALDDAILTYGDVEVVVVAPALNTRFRHWTSDEDRARRQAAARLQACVATLDTTSSRVRGWVGDADPICAIADALVFFEADELVVATAPEHRSNWLAQDVVARAGTRFELPVTEIVVEEGDARGAAPASRLQHHAVPAAS